jgi:hypothetical protein
VNQRTMNMVLWAAFFFSVVTYHALIVSNIIPPEGGPQAGAALLGNILLLLGVFQLIIIIVLDVFFVGKPRRVRLDIPGLEGKPPAQVEQAVREAKAGHYRVLFIIMCALAEATGIYGLLVYLLGGQEIFAHALMGVAYAGLIYIWLRSRACWDKMYLE